MVLLRIAVVAWSAKTPPPLPLLPLAVLLLTVLLLMRTAPPVA